MRVLWASHSSHIGGAELCLYESVSGLVQRGLEVHVALPADGPLRERLAGSGVSTSVVGMPWWMHPPSSPPRTAAVLGDHLKNGLAFSRVVRGFRPDLVVTNTLTIPTPAWVSRAMGVPHVWYIHEFGDLDHGLQFQFGRNLSLQYIRRLSRLVIVNSEAVRTHFGRHIPSEKIRLLRYAVEMQAAEVEEVGADGPLRTVLVGRKAPGKRQEDAIRALGLLRQRGIDVELTLVGREVPDYVEGLRRLAAELAVQDWITWVGHTDEPFGHMQAADVALMCSASEAFGRVTVEAMRLGRPVVGADSGGTAELIRHGWNGLLYEAGNAESLAARLQTVHEDRQELRRMGENARAWAQTNFSSELHSQGLVSILEGAVA